MIDGKQFWKFGLRNPREELVFSPESAKDCWHFHVFFILNFADFALQNMVETTLPNGLETSGRRVYR